MTYPGQAWDLIVHQGGHVELQHLDVLEDDVRGSSILLVADELLVALDHVAQLVSQVVLKNNRSGQE